MDNIVEVLNWFVELSFNQCNKNLLDIVSHPTLGIVSFCLSQFIYIFQFWKDRIYSIYPYLLAQCLSYNPGLYLLLYYCWTWYNCWAKMNHYEISYFNSLWVFTIFVFDLIIDDFESLNSMVQNQLNFLRGSIVFHYFSKVIELK